MLLYVLDALVDCSVSRVVVVVGHGAERVTKKLQDEEPDLHLEFVEQRVQRGTGDAAAVGLTALPDDTDVDEHHDVLVLPGDTPLLRPSTMASLVARHRETGSACTILTGVLDDPTGYGRVVRGKDERVSRIVEELDATPEEREIRECNTSIYCFRQSVLAPALRRLQPQNAQGEYYLTDVVSVLHDAGYPVDTVVAQDPGEAAGINDRVQLAQAEAELRRRTNHAWLQKGVTMIDPVSTYIDATVELSTDVTIFPGAILQGRTVVGRATEIGPGTRLVDCLVGDEVTLDRVTGHDAEIGTGAIVGPYAVLRPGASVPPGTVTGPFYTAS
jgi:bifunctional UDP-N-acetylglucosamine pyrophosphorylase/glucosamine-1-phosphate N-acetyltransferase